MAWLKRNWWAVGVAALLAADMAGWLPFPAAEPEPNPCGVLLDLGDDLRRLERAWPRDGEVAHRLARNEAMARAVRRCLGMEKGENDE